MIRKNIVLEFGSKYEGNYGSNHESSNDCNCVEVEVASELQTRNIAPHKFLMAVSSKISSNSRMRTGGFARPHVVKIWDAHAFEFVGMNGSRVVSPGSWSSPSVNFSFSDLNIHSVLSLYGVNIAPTNNVFKYGICNDHTFIEKSNFWSNEEKVSEAADKSVYDQRSYLGTEIALVEVGTGHSNTKHKNPDTVNKAASRSKSFRVIHRESFSWKSGRSAA